MREAVVVIFVGSYHERLACNTITYFVLSMRGWEPLARHRLSACGAATLADASFQSAASGGSSEGDAIEGGASSEAEAAVGAATVANANAARSSSCAAIRLSTHSLSPAAVGEAPPATRTKI